MRETLFRGKPKQETEYYFFSQIWKDNCKDGFVYGSLIVSNGRYYICVSALCSINCCVNNGTTSMIEVIPETVGQYTGLADKNGKKIFEGDVVKAVIVRDLGGGTQNREETGIIGYDKIGMIGLIAKYAGTIPVWSDFFQELTLSGCIDDFWFEVIGNIHDNPELIESEDNK